MFTTNTETAHGGVMKCDMPVPMSGLSAVCVILYLF